MAGEPVLRLPQRHHVSPREDAREQLVTSESDRVGAIGDDDIMGSIDEGTRYRFIIWADWIGMPDRLFPVGFY